MQILQNHPTAVAAIGGGIIVLEQILPHLPIKADSTVQLIINIGKYLIGKP